jgi:hypothetical protein
MRLFLFEAMGKNKTGFDILMLRFKELVEY